MRIALAQVPHPVSFDAGLAAVLEGVAAAAAAGARVVCFPECCLKGMRGTDFVVEALTDAEHDQALAAVRRAAAERRIHVILPTERPSQGVWHNGAYVLGADGTVQGYQTKNQVPLEEEPFFAPGATRRLFDVDGVPVGIVICHEGWRYPETARWAAVRGAKIVFHPHFSGGPAGAPPPPADSFYEHAKICRAGENHVWFASVNFAMPIQDCSSSVVAPDGRTVASAPLHARALLVTDLDPAAATAFLAGRFAPDRYASE
jgi:N-carbamoylputrescine amidase